MFYNISRDFKDGLRVFDYGRLPWDAINYKAYIIVMGGWLKALNVIGLSDDSFLNLNLVNSFVGALSVVLVYRIFRTLTGETLGWKIGMFALLFPSVVFYSATIIRDTFVLFTFAFSIYILAVSEWSGIKKTALLLACFVFMYYLRNASAFPLAAFVVVYMLLNVKGTNFKVLAIGLFFLGIVIAAAVLVTAAAMHPPKVQPPETDFMNFLSYQIHYYNKLIIAETSWDSLGIRLRNFDSPVMVCLGIVYMYFSPVPPLFVQSPTFANFFLGIGNIIWYFIAFSYAFSIFKPSSSTIHRKVWWAILITLLLSLLMVFFSSSDPRHLLFIQPFIAGFTIEFLLTSKRSAFLLGKMALIGGLILAVLYLILKFA